MMTLLQQGQVLLLFLCVAMQGDHGAEGHAAGCSLIICSDNDIIVIHNPVSVGQSSTELHPTCVWGMEEGNQTSALGKLLALYFTLVFANIDAAHMSMRLEGYTQKCRQGLWVSLYAS